MTGNHAHCPKKIIIFITKRKKFSGGDPQTTQQISSPPMLTPYGYSLDPHPSSCL